MGDPGIHDRALCHRACVRVGCPKAQGKRLTLFVDSEAIEAAIVKGTSSAADNLDFVAVFSGTLYVSRVPVDSNPRDGASRGCFGPSESRGACSVDTALSRSALSRERWHEELRHRICRNEQKHARFDSYTLT